MTNKSKYKLECIIEKNKFDLEYEIALEALTYYPYNTDRYFYEINNFGCVSGVVSKLKHLEDIKYS